MCRSRAYCHVIEIQLTETFAYYESAQHNLQMWCITVTQ